MPPARLRLVVIALLALAVAGVLTLVLTGGTDKPERSAPVAAAPGDVTTTSALGLAAIDAGATETGGPGSTPGGQPPAASSEGSAPAVGSVGAQDAAASSTLPTPASTAPPAPPPAPGVDRSSPLLARLDEQIATYVDNGGSRSEAADLARLTAETGVTWGRDMVLAMAASFCAGAWEVNQDGSPMSLAARIAWADGSSSAVGVSQDAARRAAGSGVIFQYVSLCPA